MYIKTGQYFSKKFDDYIVIEKFYWNEKLAEEKYCLK